MLNQLHRNECNFNKDYLHSMKLILQLFTLIKQHDMNISSYETIINEIQSQTHKIKIHIFPLLISFYIFNVEHFPNISNYIYQYILHETSNSLQLGHIIIMNIISCKHVYKKQIEMQKLKDIIIHIITSYHQYKEDSSITTTPKIYSSLFNVYESYEEFVDKNLIKLTNVKEYVTHQGKIKWNSIMLNKHKNDNIKSNTNNVKWLRYIAEISFINDLVAISDMLRYVPIHERNNTLKDFILYINKEYLPCELYDILETKDIDHSNEKMLLRIDDKFSFVINTRERVPFNLVFEYLVPYDNVDYNNGLVKMINKYSTNEHNDTLFDHIMRDKRNTIVEIISPRDEGFVHNNNNNVSSSRFSNIFSCFSGNTNDNSSNIPLSTYHNNINVQISSNQINNTRISNNNTEQPYPSDFNNSKEHHISPNEVGVFGKYTYKDVISNVLHNSKYSKLSKYKTKPREIISSIIKGGDELRQDHFVNNIIMLFNSIFSLYEPDVNVFMLPTMILSNGSGGIMQTIVDSASLNKINKIDFSLSNIVDLTAQQHLALEEAILTSDYSNIKKYFIYKFGLASIEYETALYNFISSLTGYSLLCYFLEIKDRNNGNILLDDLGYIYHIDFGFLLNKTPGNIKFEKAPFKLTNDFIEVLEGNLSQFFLQYQTLFYRGFNVIRKEETCITTIIELFCNVYSDLLPFKDKETIITRLKSKFMDDITNDKDIIKECNDLILQSMNNWSTNAYDSFQRYCVGIS